MNNHPSPCTDERIAAAVSGGADSMALLLLLKAQGFAPHALTVDHGLRKESADEARQVAAWCEALGVQHSILRWEHGGAIQGGLQAKAREARYRLMFDWCKAQRIRHLYTAHHMDDQVETFLFRLMRGSGPDGLAGILPLSEREGIFLHRPLLCLPKSRLIETLQQRGQAWLEDPSNKDLRHTRNALREQLSHMLDEKTTRRISQLAIFFQEFRRALEMKLAAAAAQCFSWHGTDRGSLSLPSFLSQPPELKRRILDHICKEVSGNRTPIRSEKMTRLLGRIESGKGKAMLHGTQFTYRPNGQFWEATRAKPLAARIDSTMNNGSGRKHNAK